MPRNILIDPQRLGTGNPNIQFSGSMANTIRLEVLTSGSVQFTGVSGSLLSISDNLSGSLFAVSDVSGLPILETFSDDRVVMGRYNTNALVVTGSRTGIGTSNPSARFHITGSSIVSDQTLLVRAGTPNQTGPVLEVEDYLGATLLVVSGSGFAGIGTTNPSSLFTVSRNLINGSVYTLSYVDGQTFGSTSAGSGLVTAYGSNSGVWAAVGGYSNGTAAGLGLWAAASTGAPSVYINSIGNVGIGTTGPTAGFKLDSRGSIRVQVADPRFDLVGTYRQYITQVVDGASAAASYWRLYDQTASAGRLHVYAEGTVTPGADNVQNLGDPSIRWKNIYATGISGSLTGSNVSAGQVVIAGTGGLLSGSNNFWWDNSAQTVGIGTNSPLAKLDVRGSLGIGGGVTYGNGLTISSANTSAANHTHYFRGPATGTNDDVHFDLNRGGGAYGSFRVIFNSGLIFGVAGGSLIYNGNILMQPVSNVQIATGKLSIGGPTPVSRFEVTGSGATSSTSTMHLVNGSNSSLLFVRDDGNIGIGNTNPSYKLDVTGNTQLYGNLIVGNSVSGGSTVRMITHQDRALTVKSNVSSNVKLSSINYNSGDTLREVSLEGAAVTIYTGTSSDTAGTEKVRIDSSGNVGIGSTIPVERLDVVSGSVRAKYYIGSYDGELLAGSDAGGYYFAAGFNKNTAIPIIMGSSGVTYITMRTAGTERLRINSTGLLPGADLTYDIGSSGQRWRDIYVRTGSFSGDVSISGNLTVLGVQTYVSSTVVDIGDNIITLNSTANPQRYGGLYVNDTTAGTTGSLLWDSDNNYWISGLKGSEAALPTGTGTSGLVTRWTGTNTLGTGVLYDNGTNVGIGAASDGTKLFVRKDDTSTYTETGFNTTALHLRNGTGGLSSVSLLEFSSANSGAAWWIGQVESATANQGILVFQARTGASTTAERLRINTSGNVGIGTTNYAGRLYVSGSSTASDSVIVGRAGVSALTGGLLDLQNSAGTSTFVVGSDGSLRAGTSGAGMVLDFRSNGSNRLDLRFSDGSTWYINPDRSSSSAVSFFENTLGGSVRFATRNADAVNTLRNGSSVVLDARYWTGSANAAADTSIQALVDTTAPDYRMRLLAGTGQINIRSNGNVGIGVTNPGYALDVSAAIAIRGNANADNPVLYFQANDLSNRFTVETDLDPTTTNDLLGFRSVTADNILVLRGDGNIGIGTTNPVGLLTLRGYTGGTVGSAVAAFNKTLVIGGPYNQSYNTGNSVLLHILDYSNDAGDNVYPIYVEDENNNVAFYINGGQVGSAGYAYFGTTVGIGTTASTFAPLHVYSSYPVIRLQDALDSAYVDYNTTSLKLHAGGRQLEFVAGNTQRANIESGGTMGLSGSFLPSVDNTHNLGSPAKRWSNLYVVNFSTPSISASLTGSGLQNGSVLFANATGGITGSQSQFFWDNTNSRLGIGTSAPSSKLTLGADFASITGMTIDTGNGSDSALVARKAASRTAFGILPWDDFVYLSAGIYFDGGTWVHHNDNNYNQLFALRPSTGTMWWASDNGSSSWNLASAVTLWDTGARWKSSVQSTRAENSYFSGGNVGISTTNPQNTLQLGDASVIGQDTNSAYHGVNFTGAGVNRIKSNFAVQTMYDSASGRMTFRRAATGLAGSSITWSTSMAIDPNGNIGIGVSSGVYPTIAARLEVTGSGTSTGATAHFLNSGNTSLMLVRDDGNIGIGTTSPAARLHVTGSSTASSQTALIRGGAPNQTGPVLEVEDNNGATLFVVSGSSGGNVGIGTGLPSAKFEVVGVSGSLFSVTDNLSGSLFSVNTISGLPILEVFSDNTVVAGAYNTNALVVTGSRVGIGSSNPASRLDVNDAANFVRFQVGSGYTYNTHWADYHLFKNNTSVGANLALLSNSGFTPGTDNVYDIGSQALRWRNIYATSISGSLTGSNVSAGQVVVAGTGGVLSGSNNFWWDNTNRRVGIGTNSPTVPLQVRGDGNTSNSYRSVVRIDNTGSDKWGGIAFPDNVAAADSPSNNYYFIGRGAAIADRVFTIHVPTATDYGSGAQPRIGFFSTGADRLFEVEASTGRGYFKGNLGVNTTSPGAKLQVNNAATGGASSTTLSGLNPIIYADNGSGTNGSIVIKTHVPGISSVIGGFRIASSSDNVNYSWAGMNAISDGSGNSIAANLAFYTAPTNTSAASSTERMRIDINGNVGINTTSMTLKLEVSGSDVRIHDLRIGRGPGSTITNTLVGGNSGGALAGGAIYATIFGAYAGNSISSGNYNTMIGAQAGNNTSTASSNTYVGANAGYRQSGGDNTSLGKDALIGGTGASATANTALGSQAGASITTGGNNFFGGYQAGYAVTTGASNVSLGSLAHNSLSVGNYNIAAGYQSSYQLTSGSNNITLGYQSGYYLSTGAQNVLIGTISGYLITTANYNTHVGGNAGVYNSASNNTSLGFQALVGVNGSSTGGNNTALGYQTGYSITTGTSNTLVGYTSGLYLTTGTSNTFIGLRSGQNTSVGGYNVAIGIDAGVLNTSGSFNTSVGYQAGYSSTTSSNLTSIGSNANLYQVGTGLVAVGNGALLGVSGQSNATNNTAIGVGAGQVITTGGNNFFGGYQSGNAQSVATNNVLIGYQAGFAITSGSNQTIIGYQAGSGLTTGDQNTIVGRTAGALLTTEQVNTFVGMNAGRYVKSSSNTSVGYDSLLGQSGGTTTGGSNVGVGYQAGRAIQTGAGNVYLGVQAGLLATDSSNNVLLGYQAGDSVTTGGNNVVVGAGADLAAATNSNSIVIGSGSVGLGSNTTVLGNSSTTTTYIPGNVGVGITNPGSRLHILSLSSTDAYYTAQPATAGYAAGLLFNNKDGISVGYARMAGGANELLQFAGSTTAVTNIQIGSFSASANAVVTFYTNNTERARVDSNGHLLPGADNTQNLGSPTLRWANVYANNVVASGSLGPTYTSPTSTGGGTAVFDTISTSTGGAVYELMVIGNPNNGGSGNYRDVVYGKIIIGTGYSGSVLSYISYVNESPSPRTLYPTGAASGLSVDVVYFQSGSELTSVAASSTATIRVKVSGYNTGQEGLATTVRLKQLA